MLTPSKPGSEGRGAWTTRGKDNESIWYQFSIGDPLDGARPDVSERLDVEPGWYDRVSRGVKSIQRLLTIQGYTKSTTGLFDLNTQEIVRAFQKDRGLIVDGAVGMETMKELMKPVIVSAAISAKINPKWLYAQCRQESAFDPGAQGELNWPDSGIFQFNLQAHPELTLNDVYSPTKAARLAARRFATGLETFSGKGRDLRLDCAIAQHNSPAWASQWYETGTAPSEKIADYVADTKAWALEWVE